MVGRPRGGKEVADEEGTMFARLRPVVISLWKRAAQANGWVIAGLVVVFVVLLLIPSFSISMKKEPVGRVAGEGAAGQPEPGLLHKSVTVVEGDTLIAILSHAGIENREVDELVGSLKTSFLPNDLKAGQAIDLALRIDAHAGIMRLVTFRIGVDASKDIEASRSAAEGFVVRIVPEQLENRPVLIHGSITSTLYDSASSAGLPLPILMEMIRAFSFDVDFQRDVRPGDRYEVLYQRIFDKRGRYVGDGPVSYAALELAQSTLKIYRYTTSKGLTDYFNEKGQSVRKTLIRTPIDGAWISSGYGMRPHPIYGYSEFHPALDFAAPLGTPIMAAGDGVVVYAGYSSEYGNFVKLRHRNGYSTLYAHMGAFGRGVKAGAAVAQGQVIGYVGLTGVTTGPHLHYEVMYGGEHVNPATVASPPGPVLTGEELERFLSAKRSLDSVAQQTQRGNRA